MCFGLKPPRELSVRASPRRHSDSSVLHSLAVPGI